MTQIAGILRAIAVPLAAVVLALIIGAIILIASNASPLDAYVALFNGAFGTVKALGRTLEKSTPLILSGLAVAFAFKAGLFNIGAQGQLLIGALAAGVAGYAITGVPAIIHIPLALLIGTIVGGLWGAIPGALKAYTGAHEVIVTIMMNFIAINITDYLADGPLKDTSGAGGGVIARTPPIEATAAIPMIGTIPTGFLIAVFIAVITWYLLQRTTIGYEIRTVGLNPDAARYAGIKVARTIILTMFLSAMYAGMGGSIETLGVVGRFQPGFNAGLGFDGITIALLGKTSPFGVIPAALLVGAMRAGSSRMQFDADVAPEIIDVILAMMLFFVAADMIVRWLIRIRAQEGEQVTLTTGWGGT